MFPRNVRYGDIVRGLPIKDGTAKAVYASYILEHLTRADSKPRCETPGEYLSPGGHSVASCQIWKQARLPICDAYETGCWMPMIISWIALVNAGREIF